NREEVERGRDEDARWKREVVVRGGCSPGGDPAVPLRRAQGWPDRDDEQQVRHSRGNRAALGGVSQRRVEGADWTGPTGRTANPVGDSLAAVGGRRLGRDGDAGAITKDRAAP